MRNQGQGHIRQRGENAWELKFDIGRDPLSGKRTSRFVTFHGTKREAQAELNRLLNRRNEGTYVDPTKMTVAEYLEHWLSVDIDRRLASKTAARRQAPRAARSYSPPTTPRRSRPRTGRSFWSGSRPRPRTSTACTRPRAFSPPAAA
jgi:hypothetical protein